MFAYPDSSNYLDLLNKYEKIKKEKKELEIKYNTLLILIDKCELDINELKDEKNMLIDKIKELCKKERYTNKIDNLESKINSLELENNNMKSDITELKYKFDYLDSQKK